VGQSMGISLESITRHLHRSAHARPSVRAAVLIGSYAFPHQAGRAVPLLPRCPQRPAARGDHHGCKGHLRLRYDLRHLWWTAVPASALPRSFRGSSSSPLGGGAIDGGGRGS
jgi:hypothetical protein